MFVKFVNKHVNTFMHIKKVTNLACTENYIEKEKKLTKDQPLA